jgi:hypothetical protein
MLPGITGVGDVDRDGYADAASVPTDPNPIFVLRGGPRGEALSMERRVELLSEDGMGSIYVRFVAAGDVDGDGFGDIVVSADYGRLVIFHGGGSPLLAEMTTRTSPLVLFVGTAVAVADLNGDGFSDVILGAGNGSTEAAYVYAGSELGIAEMPAVIEWGSPGAYEWHGMAGMGDIDGDGDEDVVGLAGDRPASNAFLTISAPGASPAALSMFEPVTLVGLTATGVVMGDHHPDFVTYVSTTGADGTLRLRTDVWLNGMIGTSIESPGS